MLIREYIEQEEHKRFSEYATFSDSSRGREVYEEPCDLRPVFQRDRDRIVHSKSFRRLKHKTQVFLAPYGDHYRTRLTHTLEVSQIARTVARSIRCNEDLAEAIALGHDLGHTPFGHVGERALTKVSGKPFLHSEQSVRVVEVLEKDGKGLNLTWEVRNGILNHQTAKHPATLEGSIVRLSDKIAYVNHDIDDGIRAGVLIEENLPSACTNVLGHSTRDRINTIIYDMVKNSTNTSEARLSNEVWKALMDLRSYMYDALYTNSFVKSEESKAFEIIEILYTYFMEHLEKLPRENIEMIHAGTTPERAVCDYIAGMTDNYAVDLFKEIYLPRAWQKY